MKKPYFQRPLICGIVVLLAASAAIAACGKKGDPMLPNGQKDDYPSSYPQSADPQTGVFSN